MRFTRQARHDILEIWVLIAASRPTSADRVIDRIRMRCAQLSDFPDMGPERPDIFDGARALVINRWLAVYTIDNLGPQIVRVVDASRDLTKLTYPQD